MSETLGRLATDLGERSTYDAVSQCSRCGYCEQACPTYVATGQESKSGRGRNQLVRLILEGKLRDSEEAREALSTCLLCGACTAACYAHVPTAEIVLEGRRLLWEKPHWLARLLTRLLARNPRRLAGLLKGAYFLKRWGVSRLGRPLLRLAGLGGLAEADAHLDEAPREFLVEKLGGMRAAQEPAWLYFAPCGPNYLFPGVGLATLEVLEALRGPGRFLDNPCCGLLCYNYGEVSDARELARRVIEKAGAAAPVIGDCSSCVAFLKSYPQLFLDDPAWKQRAERFALRVKDIVEVLNKTDKPPARVLPGPVVYHQSCRACHGQGLGPPEGFLRRTCPDYRSLPESEVCCGGAGAFSLLHPELSDQVLRRKVGQIAATQARRVLTSSTSCLIQLARGLKKYYPECEVMHVSALAARALRASHGTKAGA